MNYRLRSTQLLGVSLLAIAAGTIGLFYHLSTGDRERVEWGFAVFLILWAVAPLLPCWVFLRFGLDKLLFSVSAAVMLLGPLVWLIGGVFGPGEDVLGLFLVPVLQWGLALPIGIWFAFIIEGRGSEGV